MILIHCVIFSHVTRLRRPSSGKIFKQSSRSSWMHQVRHTKRPSRSSRSNFELSLLRIRRRCLSVPQGAPLFRSRTKTHSRRSRITSSPRRKPTILHLANRIRKRGGGGPHKIYAGVLNGVPRDVGDARPSGSPPPRQNAFDPTATSVSFTPKGVATALFTAEPGDAFGGVRGDGVVLGEPVCEGVQGA